MSSMHDIMNFPELGITIIKLKIEYNFNDHLILHINIKVH